VFGPELVMLGPDEQFTQLSLSGGKPKKPNQIRSLCLLLGPDFCTDVIVVETSDHARLQLQLSYNWFVTVISIPFTTVFFIKWSVSLGVLEYSCLYLQSKYTYSYSVFEYSERYEASLSSFFPCYFEA